MPQCPLLHIAEALMNPFGWWFPTRMNSHWHVQCLGLGPERIVIGVGARLIGRCKGHKKGSLGASLDRPL